MIVRGIDNFDRCLDLALLYEYPCRRGKVVVCGCEIEKIIDTPEGSAFARSLAAYLG